MLDSTYLLDGFPFRYNGHFQRLARCPLQHIPQRDALYNHIDDDWWPIDTISDTGFALLAPGFGLVRINFSECVPCKEYKN